MAASPTGVSARRSYNASSEKCVAKEPGSSIPGWQLISWWTLKAFGADDESEHGRAALPASRLSGTSRRGNDTRHPVEAGQPLIAVASAPSGGGFRTWWTMRSDPVSAIRPCSSTASTSTIHHETVRLQQSSYHPMDGTLRSHPMARSVRYSTPTRQLCALDQQNSTIRLPRGIRGDGAMPVPAVLFTRWPTARLSGTSMEQMKKVSKTGGAAQSIAEVPAPQLPYGAELGSRRYDRLHLLRVRRAVCFGGIWRVSDRRAVNPHRSR